MALVASIMRHPAIWPHVHDDGTPEDWEPTDHPGLYWMLVTLDNGDVGGIFLAHPLNSYCYEMHTCLLPLAWGEQASNASKMLVAWAFGEMGCMKLVTNVPAYNRAARRFAIAVGGIQEGVNRASFMRNGVLVDQIVFGITKQEWILCQQ